MPTASCSCPSTRHGFSDPTHTREPLYGIGSATAISLQALISFRDDSGDLYVYNVPVFAADPSDDVKDAPSLLGRTIIHRWRVRYAGGENVLEADVVSADFIVPVKHA